MTYADAISGSREEKLVSVIVPIYNTQNYLEKCLLSLALQSYSNLEIIMVNDGSADDSGAICRKYAERDNRFTLIEQENSGLGAARNTGLNRAAGDCICFVDSDDFVHPDYVRIMYDNLIKYKADVSMCSYYKVYNEADIEHAAQVKNDEINVDILDKTDLIKDISTTGPSNRSEKIVVAWNKLMRRKDLPENFRFVNKLHEDEFMINDLIPKWETAVITETKLYFYRQRDNSIMSRARAKDLKHLDVLAAYEERLRIFRSGEYKSVYKCLVQSFADNCIILFHTLDSEENHKYLKRVIYNRLIKQSIKNMRYLPPWKIKEIMIFLYSPAKHKEKYWD